MNRRMRNSSFRGSLRRFSSRLRFDAAHLTGLFRRRSWGIRALKGRLGHYARPKGREEPFRAPLFVEPALQRTDSMM